MKSLREKVAHFNDNIPMFARIKGVEVMAWVSDVREKTTVMAAYRLNERTTKCFTQEIENTVLAEDRAYYMTLRHMTKKAIDELKEDQKKILEQNGVWYDYDYGRG